MYMNQYTKIINKQIKGIKMYMKKFPEGICQVHSYVRLYKLSDIFFDTDLTNFGGIIQSVLYYYI